MAATISFYAGGYNLAINNLSGSGLGFFGVSFGGSVAVGAFQDSTYITNGAGTSQGPMCNNIKYVHPSSGQVQSGTVLSLNSIPNYQSTLNIRFTNDTSVRTQAAKLFIYDRNNINNAPSGVTTYVCPIIHPDTNQSATGSGSLLWEAPAGSSCVFMSQYNNGVSFSPGVSGLGINGGLSQSNQHDWYVAISASPNSIGAKQNFALWFQTEYL